MQLVADPPVLLAPEPVWASRGDDDLAVAVLEAIRRAGLDGERPAGLGSPWHTAGLHDAVSRWP